MASKQGSDVSSSERMKFLEKENKLLYQVVELQNTVRMLEKRVLELEAGKNQNDEIEFLSDDSKEEDAKKEEKDVSSGTLTLTQEKELYGKYYDIRRSIIDELTDEHWDDGSWGPILVRLAWHASGTYDKSDGSGGCNGATMRFKPEIDDPENKGLQFARQKLEKVKQKYNDRISYADLWIFASYVAIEQMGGPYIRFKYGRSDDKPKSLCPANGRLPSAEGDAAHIRKIFNRMGFNDQEIVCLIGGGHVLGRCHIDRSGYDGPWVDNPIKFSNEYFEELFENEWTEKKITESGKIQFTDGGDEAASKGVCAKEDELMMLPTDMVMIRDPEFRKWSEIYHEQNDIFLKDFAIVYKKLTELGCKDLKTV